MTEVLAGLVPFEGCKEHALPLLLWLSLAGRSITLLSAFIFTRCSSWVRSPHLPSLHVSVSKFPLFIRISVIVDKGHPIPLTLLPV